METREQVTIAWVLGMLIFATLSGMVMLIRQYQTGRLVIDRRQLAVRLSGGVAMLGVWAMLSLMLLYLPTHPRAMREMYWPCFGATALLALSLFFLAMVDLRLLVLNQFKHEMSLGRELLKPFGEPRRDQATP